MGTRSAPGERRYLVETRDGFLPPGEDPYAARQSVAESHPRDRRAFSSAAATAADGDGPTALTA